MVLSLSNIELIEATCVGCGVKFTPANVRQTRCKHDCGRNTHHQARHAEYLERVTRFVGVDGEGVGSGSRHNYCLLSVGSESLCNSDGSQLHVLEIFEFLWQQFQHDPNAAYVGYYLGYDFTQWLKTLPGERARMLLTKEGAAKRRLRNTPIPAPVYWKDWQFDMLNFKRFKLRYGDSGPFMYICDAGSYFQMSFLKAITKDWKHPIVTPEDLAIIREGKARRGFAQFDAEMIRYNITENKVMADLMGVFAEGLRESNIRLRNDQWYGPGQAAQAWLKLIEAPTARLIQESTPFAFRDTARKSYYGGWFEITAHGIVPGITHEYDINSAYPAIIASLPCLLHGKYSEGKGKIKFNRTTFTLVHVDAESSSKWLCGLPFRTPMGTILRPAGVRGWYWHHEVEAAVNAKLINSDYIVLEWQRYEPCNCPPPLRSIRDLYLQRLEVGKETPQGKGLKVVYNSAYGKMAQSIGEPKYSNSVYASLITAGCRVKILEAIATHPKGASDVVMIATDGIYFRTPHDKLKLHKTELGAWGHAEKYNLSLFMPGVYWDDKSRAAIRNGEDPDLKSRGVHSEDLARSIDFIDQQWKSFHKGKYVTIDGNRVEQLWTWPSMEIRVTFDMVTATQALARGAWETAGFVDDSGTKTISANPRIKRDVDTVGRSGDLLRTEPHAFTFWEESTPYEHRFGEEMAEKMSLSEIVTPEGDAAIFAIRALNGL